MTDWPKEPDQITLSAHASRHQDGGTDEIIVTGLSGLLADDQHVLDVEVVAVALALADIPTKAQSRTFHVNAFQYPNPGTDWTPQLTGAYLGVGLAAKKCWIPLNFLKVGDIITAYNLVGDAVIAGTSTLDCKLVQVNKADPLTTTDITNGGMTQVTGDGNFDVAVNPDDTTVATDKQYVLEIAGTTDAADEFTVMGSEITITRLI